MRPFVVYFAFIILILMLSMKTDNNNKSLLCHEWIEFAYKTHNDAVPETVISSMKKECTFNANGDYEESMYHYMLVSSGKWFLNSNQTKMGFTISDINGDKLPAPADTTRHFNMVILKLNSDTLIYGQEGYYGNKHIYGHDDWYFVRKEAF